MTVSSSFSLPILRNGSIGSDVTLVQRLLNNAGYGSLVEDGIFGSRTDTAVKQFQKDRNLTVDGVVGSQTWKALVPPTLSRNSRGNDVESLQITLNEIGYGNLVVDGIFGSNTEKAVKQFQKDMSLAVDGIVGQNTWYVLLIDRIKD
ncbi:peptidoglycan-binding domain-containing protein [Dapis sp. BLCC M229]|uniref:peptidoglycan-binding domain-containing protein n=1 Tax=Dapis sp. BLCC M229 TaxID=3400188 RepID=UPI003CF13988